MVNTPTPTSTPKQVPVVGDLDDDLFPDAAFVANGAADVIINLSTSPSKLTIGSGIVGAGVGQAPGAEKYSLIIAKLLSNKFVWSAVDIVTEATTSFAEVTPQGTPVIGCYATSTYAPAVFVKSKTRPSVRIFSSLSELTISLPAGTVSAVCGVPEGGLSSVFALVKSPQNDKFSVTAKNGTRKLFSSPSLDGRLRELKLGTVPRGEELTPAPAIVARLGAKQVLRVLNRSNRWKTVSLPKLPAGSSYRALYGIRVGAASYIVLQVVDASKVTSYVKVLVPAELI